MNAEATRMLNEARGRIHDADLLSGSLSRTTDSDAFLRILGFEILLKCALVCQGVKPARNHRYVQLWAQLPNDARAKIVSSALSRMPGHADLSGLNKLLTWYEFVFVKARYHYELYEGYTQDEMGELGELWVSLGAPTEEAVVQYYPNELACLIYGLEEFIESAA